MSYLINNVSDVKTIDIASLPTTDKALLVCVPLNGANANSEALYRKAAGNPETPLQVRVGSYPNPAGNMGRGLVNTSIKVSTSVTKSDTDGDEVWTQPCSLTLAWSMPGVSGTPDIEGLKALIGTALTFALPVVDGVVTDDALVRLGHQIVTDLETFGDSASV